MNILELILLIIILGFEAFQFVVILNVIKRVINSLQSRIHDLIKDEIALLLNDKDLYDSLKDYFGSLAQGIMGKIQPKGSNNIFQALMGTLLQRFISGPINEISKNSRELGEISENNNSNNRTLKNPFTK